MNIPNTLSDAAIDAELDAILNGVLDGGPLTEAALAAHRDMRAELLHELAGLDAEITELLTAAVGDEEAWR